VAIDFSRQRWQRVRETARQWWAGELDRPMIAVSVTGRDPGRPEPDLPGHHFTAFYSNDVPAERIVDRWDYNLSCRRYPGDAFPSLWPNFGPGVMAAFMGASLEADGTTCWFRPREEREISELHFAYEAGNVWLERVKSLCAAAMARWDDLVQVGMTDLGGNLDVLSTFRPAEGLLLDLYDHPAEVKRLTWESHELWFRYYGEINEVLQPTNPGYSAWAGIYSPEPSYMLQCDFCYMISPGMFDEFVKPELAAACRRLANPFYHLDGPGQLPHLDSLLEIEELKGVQWIPGAGAPDMRHWPDVYRKIREAGKLIQLFPGDGGPHVLDVVADQLGSARGIILVGVVAPEHEAELMDLIERHGAA
jgi:5-methyltetrahydrofolate--homocysteine methyltransferase